MTTTNHALPAWFDTFLTNVCELSDRNSPEDEPEAIVATLEELKSCAMNAIEQCSAANGAMGEREAFEAWMRDCEGYPYARHYANLMWKAWQARAALTAEKVIAETVVDELAMLVRKLVRHVHKAAPDNNMATMAMDYLERKGLAGSPLRDATPKPQATEQKQTPFANCSFRLCDLPGQCLGEGKCHHPAVPAAQPTQAEPVMLQHVAVAEDGGKLRWMTGRRPRDCELYAMPDGGHAPRKLYAASQPEQPMQAEPGPSCDPGDICAGCRCKYNTYDRPEPQAATLSQGSNYRLTFVLHGLDGSNNAADRKLAEELRALLAAHNGGKHE